MNNVLLNISAGGADSLRGSDLPSAQAADTEATFATLLDQPLPLAEGMLEVSAADEPAETETTTDPAAVAPTDTPVGGDDGAFASGQSDEVQDQRPGQAHQADPSRPRDQIEEIMSHWTGVSANLAELDGDEPEVLSLGTMDPENASPTIWTEAAKSSPSEGRPLMRARTDGELAPAQTAPENGGPTEDQAAILGTLRARRPDDAAPLGAIRQTNPQPAPSPADGEMPAETAPHCGTTTRSEIAAFERPQMQSIKIPEVLDSTAATLTSDPQDLALPNDILIRESVPGLRRDEMALSGQPVARHPDAHAASISRQITTAVMSIRGGEIELALAPEELGKLRLMINSAHEKPVVTVWFERPDVLDAARRHADILLQDLRDSGLENATLDLRDGRDRRHGSDFEPPESSSTNDRPHDPGTKLLVASVSQAAVRLSDRQLDIRV